MVLIANKASVYAPTGGTIAGTAVYTSGESITTNAGTQPVLLDGTVITISEASNGSIVKAAGTATFVASQIATVKVDGKKPLGLGDKATGTVVGIRVSDGSPASFTAEFIIANTGQITVNAS